MKSIVLLFLVFIVIGGCIVIQRKPGPPPHAKAYGYRAKHIYWYYPASEIYYCPNSKIYAVIEGDKWVTLNTPPSALVLGSSYVVIESDTDKPWLKHSYYKEKYSPGKVKSKDKGK